MKKTRLLLPLAAAALIAGTLISRAKSTELDHAHNLLIFNDIYKELYTNYVDTLDAEKTMRTAIDALLGQIDPYTEYYPKSEQDDLLSISSGEYAGVGSVITLRDSTIIMYQPSWDSPARKAGVRHGDVLLAIDGDTLPPTYTTPQASARLKGQPGTQVRLTLKRPHVHGTDSVFDVTVTRGNIKIDPVPYSGMINDTIGVIQIATFSEKTGPAVRKALAQLSQNPRFGALIIDLRDNGGGILDGAVQVAANFVPKGTAIVTVKGRDERSARIHKTTTEPQYPNLPIAVLTNGQTASASEILAGALQDLDRAVIVGQRSFGKGLVQNIRPVAYSGLIKVTTGRYYTPSGRLVQAIDYSHRDEDGYAIRIPDSLTNVYLTRAGREVRDGGGITPDVTVELEKGNPLVYTAVRDYWIYDFATRTANNTDVTPDPITWQVTDTMMADFKASIDPDRFKYDFGSKDALKYVREVAELSGYLTDGVKAQIDSLQQSLQQDLTRDLEINSDKLRECLDSELTSRWFSPADIYRRSIEGDRDFAEAILILSDPRRYGVLLSPARPDGKADKTGNADGKSKPAKSDGKKDK